MLGLKTSPALQPAHKRSFLVSQIMPLRMADGSVPQPAGCSVRTALLPEDLPAFSGVSDGKGQRRPEKLVLWCGLDH